MSSEVTDWKHELRLSFQWCNERYFNNTLPKDTFVEWSRLGTDFGCYNQCHYRVKGEKLERSGHRIRINVKHQKHMRIWGLTLLHEMVHLKLHKERLANPHGHKFQREMKRLAALGAFHRLW